ncbi:MAG: hypothetical protein K5923_03245 [Clostridia bacterium]|nr:hypothetical protein [Clostridia bacterium]
MKYFIVEAKCGHLGHGRYIPILFPIKAEDGKEAADIAKGLPRVKKNIKGGAILSVTRVGYLAYKAQKVLNEMDPYLMVHNKQEQDVIMPLIEHRICYEEEAIEYVNNKRESVNYRLLKDSLRCADMQFQIKKYC